VRPSRGLSGGGGGGVCTRRGSFNRVGDPNRPVLDEPDRMNARSNG
jgi:hypothetical protein